MVLLLVTALSLSGLKDSANGALLIFVVHIATLSVFVVCCVWKVLVPSFTLLSFSRAFFFFLLF